MTSQIFNGHDGVGTRALVNVLDNTNTTKIATSSNHSEVVETKLHVVNNLTSLEVDLDGVVDLK